MEADFFISNFIQIHFALFIFHPGRYKKCLRVPVQVRKKIKRGTHPHYIFLETPAVSIKEKLFFFFKYTTIKTVFMSVYRNFIAKKWANSELRAALG